MLGLFFPGESVNYSALLQSALVALLRNKMRSILTVLGITIGIPGTKSVPAEPHRSVAVRVTQRRYRFWEEEMRSGGWQAAG
jgi:hypothetical protein